MMADKTPKSRNAKRDYVLTARITTDQSLLLERAAEREERSISYIAARIIAKWATEHAKG
jgi:uncharacterized protein (DUF1778 family)